ncbi:Endo-1,4-beta-xylanase A [Xanthomonas hydrangeae]|nr:Endo-1,4-beta-xylanase A [Xanthomonas hydrangeae]CAD7731857.1 Endo-1,4-beta-xylanase A [Xanthomonas hydrangeae]CAD7747471.1 Endo-1,4-beta-xylanase A [Xanthomonas hydrangeae]CAD7747473.1 Endo-1,4-beta-xylanase A [Xanthomonas hydrangeae]
MFARHRFSFLLLAGMVGGSATASAAPSAVATSPCPGHTLKQVYADAFLIGTAVNAEIVSGHDAASAVLVACHFNALTPENVMKAEVVSPSRGVNDFAAADAFVDYARAQHMFVVGHTLVWHNQTPDWFFTSADGRPNTSAQQLERMRQHIALVAGRYVGKVQAWDVVNEIIDEDGSYRATNWVQRVGDGDTVVRNAFTFAQRYAPDAQLYYNDFNAWRPAKRDGIVRMVKMLQQAGIRIDGVGMQGHWGLNYPSLRDIEDAIDAYAALGIKVMITELDVDVLPLTKEGQVIGTGLAHKQFQLPEFKRFLDPYRDGLPPEVQAQLRDRYAELFALFWRKRDKLARVSVWGVTDGMSWKNDYPVPGRTNYPLLFDRKHQPKPALDAVLAVPADSSAR